ncbi:MAG: S-layer homology domain-containing protein [Clostridia bacterium]|nr:S-layer homology domain-containing protein [Clostridia bacterium]
MKKFLCGLMIGSTLVSTIIPTCAANNNRAPGSTKGQIIGGQLVNSFRDVEQGDWYYIPVQALVQRGLFAGKGDMVEGVGTFAPNDTMTKAEFVTVVARMFCDEDEINCYLSNDSIWWDKYYNTCVAMGIFNKHEIPYTSMEQCMTREEMSLVAERAVRKIEGNSKVTYDMDKASSVIPDFDQVSNHLKSYVVQAYADGLLCGTDDAGSFAPKSTLTRAEAATVLYRIVESNYRTPNSELGGTDSSSSGL